MNEDNEEEAKPLIEKEKPKEGKEDLYITTTGLIVHSLAEGVAMGSSLFSKFLFF